MMTNSAQCVSLPTTDLVPLAWQSSALTYVFNPCIATADNSEIIAFYRVVRQDLGRRIAACRLDASYRPIPGSARPFSDEINADNPWYADPRVYVIGGELFVYWNTGIPAKGENEQFLVRVDRERLAPSGNPIKLEIKGSRQKIEKNWILFEHDDGLHAIYSIAPHRILKLENHDAERMLFVDTATTYWDSRLVTSQFGAPRGGAQPLKRGDRLYHFSHASIRHADGSIYVAQCYEFDAKPPFALTRFTADPLLLPNPLGDKFTLPKLNSKVKSVVYPAGNLALENDEILLSYGVNDEAAFVAVLPFAHIERQLRPVKKVSSGYWHVEQFLTSLRDRIVRRFNRLTAS